MIKFLTCFGKIYKTLFMVNKVEYWCCYDNKCVIMCLLTIKFFEI